MHITERFLAFTLLGAEWVLWLLIGLVDHQLRHHDRARLLLPHAHGRRRVARGRPAPRCWPRAASPTRARAVKGADSAEMTVVAAGLDEVERGVDAVAEAMVGQKARERMRLERNLAFLGTLGNNAPFIGLFGTVLGIINAFHDLSGNQAGGVAGGHGRHLRGARRHRRRPHGRHPGRRRVQLLQPPRAPDARQRRRARARRAGAAQGRRRRAGGDGRSSRRNSGRPARRITTTTRAARARSPTSTSRRWSTSRSCSSSSSW